MAPQKLPRDPPSSVMDLLPLSLTRTELKLSRSNSTSTDKRIERRKPNWTECENVFLLDQFSIHREILTCKATDASTNLRKQEVWRVICQNLNIQNTLVRRTPAEVRRKWKNLVTAAKKEVWEMRHQAHVTGASRKISELSQRVLQLHSSSLFIHHLHHSSSVDEDLRYGDRSSSEDYYNGSSSHFAPIVTLNENVSSPTGSMSSDSESRNEFDSGIYEEAHDLRVNVVNCNNNINNNNNTISTNNNLISGSVVVGKSNSMLGERKTSETTTEEICKSGDDLVRLKLELQIDVLKLRKRKLEIEVRRLRRGPGLIWMRRRNNLIKKKLHN